MVSPAPEVAYLVKDGHTLGYTDPMLPGWFAPLAGKPQLGGHDWKNGPVAISPLDRFEVATLADFERFRVCPKGHIA